MTDRKMDRTLGGGDSRRWRRYVRPQVYCWRRARGESKDAALAEIVRASGYSSEVNIAHLTKRCLAAEGREQERAAGPPAPANTFIPEAQGYRLARARGTSRREAVEQVAKHFGHGRANRPALEKRLSEVEAEFRAARPVVEVSAIAGDAKRRLAELEQTRLRLSADALIDSEVRDELESVEADIAYVRRTLELVDLAQTAQPAKAAA